MACFKMKWYFGINHIVNATGIIIVHTNICLFYDLGLVETGAI